MVLCSMCMGSRSPHCVSCEFDIVEVDMEKHGSEHPQQSLAEETPTCTYSTLNTAAFSLTPILPKYLDDSINTLVNYSFSPSFIYEDRKINTFTA